MKGDLQLFALDDSRDFGEAVARALGIDLAKHEERSFEDGEHKTRPLENVRGRDVYVVQSLYSDDEESVNDKLCRLLFFLGALRDAGVAAVTAVVPYLCYARKDRKTKSRDPVTTRYIAQIFEAVGVERVVTMDVHNLAAFQNAFRCRTVHLEARRLFASYFSKELGADEVAVVSPDAGGVKRADAFRETLQDVLNREVAGGMMEKKRSGGVVSGDAFVGEVAERAVLLVDDLISTGTTISRAARASRANGARAVYAVATHGLFVGAEENLRDDAIDQIVVADTIPPFRLSDEFVRDRLHVVPAAPLFAKAIQRIHTGDSLEE